MDQKNVEDVNCTAATQSSHHPKFSENQNLFGSNTSVSDADFVEPLTMRLNQFRLKGIGCDVMFVVGDEQERFLVHKLVLGCSSPVFHAMFFGPLCAVSAKNNSVAILPACTINTLEDMQKPHENHIKNDANLNSPRGQTKGQQIASSNELSEKFNNFSTRDDRVGGYSQSEKKNHPIGNLPAFRDQTPQEHAAVEDVEEIDETGDDFAEDEEESEEEEAEEDMLCSTSSADCSFTSSSYSTSAEVSSKSPAKNIIDGNNDIAAANVPTSIQNGNGNPFDPQNSSLGFSASASTSPPMKVQRKNLEQQFGSSTFLYSNQRAKASSSDELGTEHQNTSPKIHYHVHFANSGEKPSYMAGSMSAMDSYTRFCGSVCVETIPVPDISPIAFGIMVDYIYNNYDVKCAELTDDNVMHTLYAAKKYDLHSLVSECVRYLLNGLSPGNAVCLLAQARLFQEETLMRQCFEVIDKNTDVALQATSIADIDRDTLMEVLGRSELDPSSELVIFYAARAWAEAECERRQIPASLENLRVSLGPALQLIRFPLMNVTEFGQAANSSVLNFEEITEVFLYLTVKPRKFCRYPNGFRSSSRSKHAINRFSALSSKRCTRRENKICFTADRDILVSALGIYGIAPMVKPHIGYTDGNTSREWSCQVEIQLASMNEPSIYGSSVCHSATNNVFLHGIIGDTTPCTAYFDSPVPCHANVTYIATIRFISENGVQTFSGKEGKESITVDLPYDDETVTFKFQSYRNSYGNDDGGKVEGQIPSLHFLVQWPEEKTKKLT